MAGRLADRLERGGFVRREPDPADRRHVVPRLVPERVGEIARYYEGVAAGACWGVVLGLIMALLELDDPRWTLLLAIFVFLFLGARVPVLGGVKPLSAAED